MAYTDLELETARDAVDATASAEDLFKLGLMYATEDANRRANFVEAHKWLNLAAMKGSRPAKAYREEITAEMSSQDVANALRAARTWMQRSRSRSAA